MANHSLSRNKFAKRHYEAIAQAMQEAPHQSGLSSYRTGKTMPKIGYADRLAQHRRAVITLAHQSAKRAVKSKRSQTVTPACHAAAR